MDSGFAAARRPGMTSEGMYVRALSFHMESSFPRKREPTATGKTLALDRSPDFDPGSARG
jgi:hypothetical protein